MTSLFPHLLCLLLLLLPLSTFSQTSCNSLSTLDANPYCSSPSGEFAFGFHPIQGADQFLVAIWFAKIQVENIVWTANGGNPVQKGSKIELTSNGILVLYAPNGTELWKAEPTDGTRATSAAMLDTGNFVLRSPQSDINWQSFAVPTDTILLNQTLGLGLGSKLVSRRTKDDYSTGRFEFILQDDGNLVMYPLAWPKENTYNAYWASNTVGNGSGVVFNQSGYIYLNLKNGSRFSWTSERPVSTRDFYHRVTLDFDGVLRKYTYPKKSPSAGTESWSVAWFEPENICTASFGDVGSGVCGFNSYCKLDQDRPGCICPFGYTYVDPNNTFKGCKQNFDPQSCRIDGSGITEGFVMRGILNTDWPTSDYEWFKEANEDWCSETCLNDCLCAVAIIRGADCWFKKLPLSKGKMDANVGGKALIKVGNSNSSKCIFQKEDKDNQILLGSILLGSSGFLNLLLILVICLAIFHGSYRKKQLRVQPNPSMIGVNLRSFTYKELEDATDGFKEELGRGAFSTVYKGVLESYTGSHVAVKKLDRLAQEIDKEFKNEVSSIGQTNHKNLAKLVGFCDEGTNRILVYEFMRNGSLASFLFGGSMPEWYRRIQIAFGIARGLTYLHEECSTQIIHCDVKPQNVLLDDAFVARISDFGLAKLLKNDQTRTSTGIRGTRGYVAPEWYKNMAITAKVDVYSFGIMLLEIICCRRNAEFELGNEDGVILSEWAYDCCVEGNLQLLVENDEGAKNDGRRLQRLIMVAIWCIQEDPSLRPTMRKVTQMLEGAVEVSMPPDPLSFISSIG